MPANVTLDDVARRVGVSARTVSRVVNDQGGCTEATRARILAAIDELGYRPNMLARGLITRRSDTIGLIGVEMSDPFFTEVAEGVQRAARDAGRTMFFASTDHDSQRQWEILQSLWSHGVDGVMLFPVRGTERQVIDMAARGLPIVSTDVQIVGRNVGTVTYDLFHGAALAVEHLIARGRRRVAMAGHDQSLLDPHRPRRETGYRRALDAAGQPFVAERLAHASNNVAGGRAAVRQLLTADPMIDAIFAYNDLMAIGALQQLSAMGRKVPDDVAVVGFDDIAMCEALTPRLTSVSIDRDLLGREAVRLLTEMSSGSPTPEAPVDIGLGLVIRDSS